LRLIIIQIGGFFIYMLIKLRGNFYQVKCGILWLRVESFVYDFISSFVGSLFHRLKIFS